jgi:hypothetical protein
MNLLSRTQTVVLLTLLTPTLSSCGVCQLATCHDEDEADTHVMIMAMAPVLLITGDYPANPVDKSKPAQPEPPGRHDGK